MSAPTAVGGRVRRSGYALLVHNATLITCDPAKPSVFQGWFAVDRQGKFSTVQVGDPGPEIVADRILDAGGALVGPGFVSSHSHLFTSPSRGLATDQSLYGWIAANNVFTNAGTVDDIYWFTRHGAQDFLRNGVTTAYDFSHALLGFENESAGRARFSSTLPNPDYQHAQLLAKVDAGLRHIHSVSLGQGDVPRDQILGVLDDSVTLAVDFRHHPTHLGVAISGAVQWAESRATAEVEVTAMQRYGLVNQPHFLETPHGIEAQQKKFEWYQSAGALGPDLVFGHFIHASDEILDAAATAGCGMSWQPMSNGRLASGVARVPEIRDRGIRVGIGLDDQSCTDVADPFSNMRTGIALLRAHYRDPEAMPIEDMLMLHTRGAAETLDIDHRVGSIKAGLYADFLVVDPRDPDTGPVWDPVATYVLACSLRNLKQVWVGGEQVADGSRLLNKGAASVQAETHKRMAVLRDRVQFAVFHA